MASQTPKSVALVGRPNVGKSRLFNRILGRRVSIVHDKPGVTRDIVVEKLTDSVALMDTGGLGAVASGGENIIAQATNRQAKFAIDTADTTFRGRLPGRAYAARPRDCDPFALVGQRRHSRGKQS